MYIKTIIYSSTNTGKLYFQNYYHAYVNKYFLNHNFM